MSPVLRLLGGVSWQDAPVVGDRQRALLTALAEAGPHGASTEWLTESVWNGDAPADPHRALQVVVSRVRKLTAASAIARTATGYRLALGRDEVDAWAVVDARDAARRGAAAGDWPTTRDAAARGLALAGDEAGGGESPVCLAARAAAAECAALHGLALSRLGDHEHALPALAAAVASQPSDDRLRHALLRSTAAVQGGPAALAAYEDYRRDLAERLGSDPGPELQRLHRELLLLDQPVRTGVTHDASTLLGRDSDLAALHELTNSGRVTTILGAGGLGKTRLARVLARAAEQPVMHFVELAGVTSRDMLLPELAVSLGVQDQTSARSLRATRPGDLRARVIEELAGPPTLLVLDNCEQIVDAVAGLVTLLVGTLPDLTVLTTSRAPLGITPERVYALPQLSAGDAAALFTERARAARPEVVLDPDVVRDLVARLDGLPLAIELAAARVRVMSAVEIRDRLGARFALLRTGARDAPERHQTLWAVIDWSWALLTARQQRVLRWLSVFPDGFGFAAADAVLSVARGEHALPAVDELEQLVAQSLITVHEMHEDGATRYRMLETVREFGREQLLAAGDSGAATRAFIDWAAAHCSHHVAQLYGSGQVAAVRAMRREETNISNALATVIERRDPSLAARIGACLLSYWSISGELDRTYTAASAISDVLRAYDPPPAERDAVRWVLACEATMTGLFQGIRNERIAEQLHALGPGDDPWVAALVGAALDLTDALAAGDVDLVLQRLAERCDGPDRRAAIGALRWRIHFAENNGDLAAALADAEALFAKCDPAADGPFLAADARATTAMLLSQSGRRAEAAAAARAAIGPLAALGATETVTQLRVTILLAAVDAGDLDEARTLLSELQQQRGGVLHARAGGHLAAAAELAFAAGDVAGGLQLLRDSIKLRRNVMLPDFVAVSGFVEPWLLSAIACATSAYAQYDPDGGRDLYDECVALARRALDPTVPHIDVPVVGAALYGIALWRLVVDAVDDADIAAAVDMLAVAAELGYHQSPPSMDVSRAVAAAEQRAPGALAAARVALAGRPNADLLDDARRFIAVPVGADSGATTTAHDH